MLRSTKLASARETTHKIDLLYMHLFNNPDGKMVLEDLVRNFLHDKLSTGEAHSTCIRASQADVIRYIQRRIEDGVDGKSVR